MALCVCLFKSEDDLNLTYLEISNELFYKGKIEDLTYEKASKIAQIHPNCTKYYENAMMPLFKGKGKFSSGTENPILALESYKTKNEIDIPYMMIWKIFDNE
jgi:hypothetical protein